MPPPPPPHRADSPFIISADVVVPMVSDKIYREAGVVVDRGKIAATGPLSELRRDFGELPREHVPGVMIPGLVNSHVHLELGYQRTLGTKPRPARFTDWVAELMRNYPIAADKEGTVAGAVKAGVAESVRLGVTCLGDISRESAITRRELASASGGDIRAVSFGEVMGLGKMRGRLAGMLEIAADRKWESEQLKVGISPHAPYTVEGPSLESAVQFALAEQMPIAMHLAEHLEEKTFLRDLSGMLGKEAEIVLNMDLLDERIPLFGGESGGPIHWAEHWGLLGPNGAANKVPLVLAHVNYCDDAELAILAKSGASVAYCPRTRAYFGHDAVKPHRYRDMLEASINVCLGTDSLASNPDLSVLAEAACLHHRDNISARQALEMITWRGAKALGDTAGRLAQSSWADIIVLPSAAGADESLESLLSRLLSELSTPRAVWLAGRRIV